MTQVHAASEHRHHPAGYRAISYDALTTHTAIVFTRYMILALEQRRNVDERSLGELFFQLVYRQVKELANAPLIRVAPLFQRLP